MGEKKMAEKESFSLKLFFVKISFTRKLNTNILSLFFSHFVISSSYILHMLALLSKTMIHVCSYRRHFQKFLPPFFPEIDFLFRIKLTEETRDTLPRSLLMHPNILYGALMCVSPTCSINKNTRKICFEKI